MKLLSQYLKNVQKLGVLSNAQFSKLENLSNRISVKFHYKKASPRSRTKVKLNSILFVTGIYPDINHGGGLRVFDLISSLSASGISVDLFCPEKNDGYSYGSRNKYKVILERFHMCKTKNFTEENLYKFVSSSEKNYETIIVVWPWTIDIISDRIIGDSKLIFDYIECTSKRLLIDLSIKAVNKKIVNEFWESIRLEGKAYDMCDGYIYVTNEDRYFIENIHGRGKKKLCIPSYLNESFLRKNIVCKEQPSSVCFVGNYLHYPNLDGLVWYIEKCHGKILSQVPNYKFYVIGSGAKDKIIDLQIKYKKYKNSIEWVGEVRSVSQELSKYEMCISPLVSGAGFRGKVVQYSSLKKATVSTSIGVSGTKFKHKSNIFVADHPKYFSSSVIELLENKNLRSKFGERAQKVVMKHYTWPSKIKDIVHKLESV